MTQILSTSEKNQVYVAMASDFIKGKQCTKSYIVNWGSSVDDSIFSRYVSLNDEQRAEVEALIAQAEQEDMHLWECVEENPLDYLINEEYENYGPLLDSVELDTPYYASAVKVAAFMEGVNDSPRVFSVDIYLSEQEYTDLLSWQLRMRTAGFNDLFTYEPELFAVINDKVRSIFSADMIMPYTTPVYAVELVGIKQEAFDILGEKDHSATIYSDYSENSIIETGTYISERKMYFNYNKVVLNGESMTYLVLNDIDAIAVEKAMGVDSYQGIIDTLKAQFAGVEGFDNFRCWLEKNDIEYTFIEPVQD